MKINNKYSWYRWLPYRWPFKELRVWAHRKWLGLKPGEAVPLTTATKVFKKMYPPQRIEEIALRDKALWNFMPKQDSSSSLGSPSTSSTYYMSTQLEKDKK